MKELATKSTAGWYGMRLHGICNKHRNILKLKITTASAGEREVIKNFLSQLTDTVVIGDGGYVFKELDAYAFKNINRLITAKRKNMKVLYTIY